MNRKQVRLGVLGLGPRGRGIAKLYAQHPNCRIVALCDRIASMNELAAAEIGDPDVKCYTDYEQMLASEPLDALFIAAPPDIQVEMACYAMERGIHVTTEVPAAYTLQQCWDLVRTVEKTGVKYQLSEQTRYWGFIRQWKEMAARGDLGKILFAEGEYLHFADWDYFLDPKTGERFNGSAAPPEGREVEQTWRQRRFIHPIYYLPHTLSPLLSITGGRVTRVSCMGTRPESYYVDNLAARDIEVALMHTDNDVVYRVATGFTSPHGMRKETGYHWYQLKGTKGSVEWNRTSEDKPKMWTAHDDRWRDMNWSTDVEEASDYIRQSGHGGSDGWPIENFLQAILEDTPIEMDVYKAAECAAPAILAAESSHEGGALKDVPDFRKRG